MKKTGYLLVSLLLSAPLWAQSPQQKGLDIINQATAEAHVGFLASDELQGREAGFHGGRIAGEYIVANLKSMGIEPLGDSYYYPFEAYRLERQKKGRWQVHPDSIAELRNTVHQKLSLNNILGKIEGKNPDEYVIVGAHYDHLGIDPMLDGDQIYNGADDNASGVSAVLQIARAFLASGEQPEKTVVFAFWDGEEKGLLGSKAFVQSFPEMDKVRGYLNFDMIGRNHIEDRPNHVVYFYTESHPVFGKWLKEDIKRYNLNLDPDYRPWDNPVGGSDNGSFAKLGVPIIWYHTDGHPDYHLPSDEADKINWDKLVNITKASFLNMWNMANEKKF
ncbi:M20/M25/M40 family metallo-hydrolase [Parabacteroides bouchesdurhonensis]|uniref:M20/M25/M40 family metallo-hydrolase n=1 Tax=Parabacteroides bouchesdurhonensis TaxID=1936995 RepID=UPI000C848390|nr:M20/M25/M40 family metallo-hydrolase [Parabacteroides bouchesdurhonensis]